jgi:chromosome segregation ATPase
MILKRWVRSSRFRTDWWLTFIAYQQKLQLAKDRIGVLEKRCDRKDQGIEELEKRVDQAKDEVAKVTADLSKTNGKLAETQQELANASENLQKTQQDHAKVTTELSEAQESLAIRTTELVEARRYIGHQKLKINNARKKAESITADLADVTKYTGMDEQAPEAQHDEGGRVGGGAGNRAPR